MIRNPATDPSQAQDDVCANFKPGLDYSRYGAERSVSLYGAVREFPLRSCRPRETRSSSCLGGGDGSLSVAFRFPSV